MEEIWKDIEGYEGIYQISNLGNVKSLKFGRERILMPAIASHGYLTINLHKNSKQKTGQIHQLVAMAFLNHTPSRFSLVVNHKNFIKTDNRVENLEITTNRENSNKKHIKSSSDFVGVSWNKRDEKWVSVIQVNGKSRFLGKFITETEAAEAYQRALSELI